MDRQSFVAGVRDVAPALVANASVGVLFGASAVDAGLSPAASTAFSLFSVAARSQLVAVELIAGDAAVAVVVATVVLINVRYATFSAALAPRVEHLSWRWRALIAYPLIDITFAFADAKFADPDTDVHRGWYFAGVGLPWAVVFASATLVGALLGRAVGERLRLEFVVPLLFIALLVPQIESRQALTAAAVAAAVAVIGVGLPFNLGLLAAGLVGAAIGTVLDTRAERTEGPDT